MIACPNLKNPDVAREFEELRNATTSDAAAYRIWSLNGGNHIDKAPNGAESILFNDLLKYYKGDRIKAIRAKAKLYSNSFLNWFGDWTGGVTVQVYLGRKTLEVDNRRYNYWSLDEDEVRKDYGQHVRSVRINPEGFLMKNVKRRHQKWNGEYVTDWTWSEEYEKVIEEFKQKTGYEYFDILENGEKGIKKQSEFFAFLEEKGYKGYMEYDLRMYDGDNHYAVTFGNQGIDEVSKVVDENGEPRIVYHWSRSNTKFAKFDVNKITVGGGFWFGKKDYDWFGKQMYAAYLNMKHPYTRQEAFDKKYGKGALGKIHQYLLDLDRYYNEVRDNSFASNYFPIGQDAEFNFTEPVRPTIEFSLDVIAEALNILWDYDGEDLLNDTSNDPAMYRSRDTRMLYEKLGFDGEFVGTGYIVVHNPNQIKSVDNEGTFLAEDDSIYLNSIFDVPSLPSRSIKNNIKNGVVLSTKDSKYFEQYVLLSRGLLPKLFYLQDNVTLLVKTNNYKNSRRYDIINTKTGEIIANGVPIYTKDEVDKIKRNNTFDDSTEQYNYNEQKSLNFKKFLLTPSSGLFKLNAKLFILNAIRKDFKYGETTFDLTLIDEFVNKFPEGFWESVLTFMGHDAENVGGYTTRLSDFSLQSLSYLFLIPKQGLILNIEKLLGIKIQGKKLKTFVKGTLTEVDIKRTSDRWHLIKALINWYNFSQDKDSIDEHIKMFVDTHPRFTVAQIKLKFDDLETYDSMNDSLFRQYIRNYSKMYWAIDKVLNDYRSKLLDKLFGQVDPKVLVSFNKDTAMDVFDVINTVFHEPYHALDLLTKGSKENKDVYDALHNLLLTVRGSQFKESFQLFAPHFENFEHEMGAVVFSMIMMPEDMRLEFVKNHINSSNTLLSYLSTYIFDLLHEYETTSKYTESAIKEKTTKERVILKKELGFIKKCYNFIAKALQNAIPFIKLFIPLFEEIYEYEYEVKLKIITVSETKEVDQKTAGFENSILRFEFLQKLEDFASTLRSLLNVNLQQITKEREVEELRPSLNEQINSEEPEQEYTEQQVFDDVQQLDSELEEYIAGQEIHEPDYNVRKTTQPNGKIRLSLPSHTEEKPRQIVLDPQGDNKFYVHIRIWNGEKIPGDISDSEKRLLFDALYDELPDGAEILFPKSGPGYYGTRGTVAGLMRLSRDSRFTPGTPGVLLYEDKNGQIKTYEGTSFIKTPSTTKTVQQATEEWGQKKQREIMGETQLHLAQAFGLTLQEDGTWATDDNSAVGKLRVEFVNSMSTPGSIDFNEASTNAHTVIAIGLNEADASTFNHELAHYYIRTFWNSKAVQDALDMVYVKEMGDYKNDPAARIAVEEALADYMTQRTIDSSFLTNIESLSYFLRFWEAFNKMLYKVFNIKTNAARNAILSQITKSFYVNEKLDDNNRKIKYVMHRGTMYQTEAQRRRVRTNRSTIYQQVSRSDFENTVGKIVKAIQSKAKSYLTLSIGKANSVYGDELQIAFNQESVRIVKEFSRTLGELQAAKDDAAILNEKFKLIMSFLERADEEANRVLRMFKNARANSYKKVMYNVDSKGNRQYEDASNAPIVPTTATPATQQREFSWDDLQYAKNDIVGFFKEVIDNVKDIVVNAQDFGLSTVLAQQLLDFIQNSGVSDNVELIERLYNESRRKKCLEWIDETVNSRDELDDDFKNRLKINMYKWLDEQMDFGDVSVFEKYAGMASMSKSPILRAFLDEISKMQQEKDEAVHKKALELRDKLAQARKEAGLKYRILPFNILKLLMQLDKYGLPTGNLISKYNQGLYKKDLAEYRDLVLFGKGGIEDKLKALKDASGKPLFGKGWKLKLDEYDNLVLPDDPLCYDIEKEYMKLIEDFKGDREIRRFTKQYYIDRINTLSTTTLRRLNELEERIRRITEAVTIKGKLRIDLLTEDQLDLLKMLYDQRSQMGSLTNIDGSYKVPGTEEFKVAEEIKAWRLKTRGKIRYTVDWVAYRDAENNTKDRYAFQKRFTKIVINPQIWDELLKFKTHYPESDPRVRRLASLKYDRTKLIAPYQGFEIGQFDWDSLFDESTGKLKNEKFFENLRKLDEEISNLQQDLWEDYKPAKGLGKKQPQVLEELMIPAHLIPGVSKWRPALNSPADQSQYDFMIKRIREAVNNDPSMNATQKALEILRLESLLLYHDAREDIDMSLSMFSVLLPINSVVTEINKKKFLSFVLMPTSVFLKVDTRYGSAYVDTRYDDTKSGILLTDRYLDKRYQKYFSEDSKLKELLEAAQDCMKEGFKMIPFLQEYDGRMALVGARTGLILGRKWYDPRRMWKNFCEFLRREWEIVETDTQFLPNEEYETRPDGSKILNIPLRFIRRLDNPEYISSDVIGSVIKFYDMAKNYQIKARNASKLTSILNELSKRDNLTAAKAQGRWNTSLSEIVEGILDRQVFETKNVDSNSRQNFIENEWSHLDWFRRYFISNPATWLKRLSKSRAAFLLGMLALNVTSGIISFLDPLISMTIDTITGKYINYKDLAYATEKLAANSVGNGLSLGSAKAYSKAAAGMQKFALSKSVTESFKDLDLGRITRFLSDGLTMKHFTLGDYTINSINMIATMHNYKYYKKADGTAGFYPKHQYISIVMKDLKCDVRKARSIYNKAVCMWDSCERDNLGDLVASNNEYGNAITDKTWNDVRSQVRSRSSIYNGIVPDLERSLMQTNIIWSFVTMLRNFFITGIWERFQSYRDFQVASLDEYGNPVDRPSTQEEIRIAKRELRYYKGGFSFSTRTIEDGVDRAAFLWISNIFPYLKYAMHILIHPADRSKYSEGHQTYLKENNLAQTDIYGILKIFMELIVFSMLLLSSGFTQRWADDNQDNYWIQMLNLLTLRLTVERFTWFSPQTAMELISSPTAALSDWKRKIKLLDLTYDAIGLSDYKLHDEVKRGRYAGAERWKYNLFNGLSSFGLNNWYADTPEELGGGGARSVREKSNFYRGLVRGLPFGRTVIPRRDNTKSNKKHKKMSH